MKIRLLAFFNLATIILFLFTSCGYALTIDRLVIFGDSLSDNGNLYLVTKNLHEIIPQIPIIPKADYYYQGRFSNGLVWVDNLAKALNIPLADYAYAGSWAEPLQDSKLNIPFGLAMQVSYYLVSTAIDIHRQDHLFIIWTGSNDYIEGRQNAEYATSNTIKIIRQQIDRLIFAGARKFLVLNVPDLGLVPQVMAQGPDFARSVSNLASMHNRKFNEMINHEKSLHPDVTILSLDVNYYFNDIITNPTKYRLTDVQKPCYTGGYWFKNLINSKSLFTAKEEGNLNIMKVPSLKIAYLTAKAADLGDSACTNPDEHLFWDQIHPTRVIHEYIAMLAENILQSA